MQPASKGSLGPDVVSAIIEAKHDLLRHTDATPVLKRYEGKEISDPDMGRPGTNFFEKQVGQARPGDSLGTTGRRRLVLKVQSGRIVAMLFTDRHYKPGSWVRIVDF
jgi:hypothetical protein